MGNKFFLQTGAQCMVKADENGNAIAAPYEDDRYIYINNIQSGNIPFLSAGVGANFTSFRGLVPGTLEQMNNFNPISMLTSLVAERRKCNQDIDVRIKKLQEAAPVAAPAATMGGGRKRTTKRSRRSKKTKRRRGKRSGKRTRR